MGFEPNRPYNDLPLLPPKAELESHEVLKKAIAAHKALAELKGMLNTIPNPAMLINTIVFREAKSSSLIENVVTTNDKLYQSAAVPASPTDPHTKEVLNYRLLRNVTEKEDWQPRILYMLEGMEQTAGYTVKLVESIRSLLEKTAEKIKKDLPKIYSRELVNVLFEQPYCRIQNLVEAGLASRNTASKYMKALEDICILELHKVWKENLYLNKKLWSLLKRS